MTRYDDIKNESHLSKLTPASEETVAEIKARCPGIPQDYLDFLREVGSGEVGESDFMIYEGPVAPEDVFGRDDGLSHLLLLGDDFQGYCVAFDPTREWVVVEIDPTNRSVEVTASSFSSYVRNDIL